MSAQEAGPEFFGGGVGGEDFADAFLLGLLGGDEQGGGAGGLPAGEQVEKVGAGLLLGAESLLGDEIVGRVAAVVDEALGVPGVFGDRGEEASEAGGGRGVEEGGGFVEVGDGVEGGDAGEDGCERGGGAIVAGEEAEGPVEHGGFDEEEAGGGGEVGGEAGEGRREGEAGRGGEGEPVDGCARALGDGIEFADVLELVAEEIESVGLRGVDGVEVDDAAADGVGAGRLAHGFAVVVERADFLEEGLEGVGGAFD